MMIQPPDKPKSVNTSYHDDKSAKEWNRCILITVHNRSEYKRMKLDDVFFDTGTFHTDTNRDRFWIFPGKYHKFWVRKCRGYGGVSGAIRYKIDHIDNPEHITNHVVFGFANPRHGCYKCESFQGCYKCESNWNCMKGNNNTYDYPGSDGWCGNSHTIGNIFRVTFYIKDSDIELINEMQERERQKKLQKEKERQQKIAIEREKEKERQLRKLQKLKERQQKIERQKEKERQRQKERNIDREQEIEFEEIKNKKLGVRVGDEDLKRYYIKKQKHKHKQKQKQKQSGQIINVGNVIQFRLNELNT
eukprot:471120_1